MQGFNMGRYVPPDVEGTTTGNKLHKKRPPGFSGGQQTVRFEMPFAIWCAHCPQPTLIAQGVRFNAAKRKVGSYLSTPIFAFRLSHAACGGAIEIRTDPQHTTYTVTEGARRRDTGSPDPLSSSSTLLLLTDNKEREDQRASAFAKLEKTIADRTAAAGARERIDELARASAARWEDPYERNRRLRAAFRADRKERERDGAAAEDLRERMSLGIELLPASDEDARRAALVDFGPSSAEDPAAGGGAMGRNKALAKPLFFTSSGSNNSSNNNDNKNNSADMKDDKKKKKTKDKKLKSEVAAAQMRDSLVSEIVGNTRVAQDPFLSLDRSNGDTNKGPARIAGIKRKRQESELQKQEESKPPEKGEAADMEQEAKGIVSLTSLVEYDSD
ncbi:DUF455 domain protein [Daldinia caldariorum]|uniref:DUF455 domain protein n=1 Tax=Daldinia caldariorum TaxID=326644 RepID=UPI002007CB53|nr:DUF455 domain protein [Daldinia caldariorum]KAI1473004.1 DUF455 domain protein [Daldinia caldariorum]